jgi:hypothetical protein
MLAIFLACGSLVTFERGGITTILFAVAKAGLGKSFQEVKEPEDPLKKVEREGYFN